METPLASSADPTHVPSRFAPSISLFAPPRVPRSMIRGTHGARLPGGDCAYAGDPVITATRRPALTRANHDPVRDRWDLMRPSPFDRALFCGVLIEGQAGSERRPPVRFRSIRAERARVLLCDDWGQTARGPAPGSRSPTEIDAQGGVVLPCRSIVRGSKRAEDDRPRR